MKDFSGQNVQNEPESNRGRGCCQKATEGPNGEEKGLKTALMEDKGTSKTFPGADLATPSQWPRTQGPQESLVCAQKPRCNS